MACEKNTIATMLLSIMLVVTTFGLFRGDTPINMGECGFIAAALIIISLLFLTALFLWFFYSFYYQWAESWNSLFMFILLCLLYSLFPLLLYNFVAAVSKILTGTVCLYDLDTEQLGLTVGYGCLILITFVLAFFREYFK